MLLVKKLVRNYYEANGSFTGIFNKIGELLNKYDLGMSDLYEFIGYKHYAPYHASEIYMIRKAILENNLEKAKQISQLNSRGELLEILEKADLPVFEFKEVNIEHKNYVSLLANYLRYSRSNITESGDFRKELHELTKQPLQSIILLMNTPEFKSTMKTLMPVWKYVENVDPAIQLGTFYISEKLNAKERNEIQNNAIKAILFNTLEISEEYRMVIKTAVKDNFTELYDSDNGTYRAVCDLAMSMGISVKEVLTKCNMTLVDYIDQYIKHRCIFSKYDKYIRLCVRGDLENFISPHHFKILYENNHIDYLVAHEGAICVDKGNKISINKIQV